MRNSQNGTITPTQATIIIINYTMSVAILTLPRAAANEVGTPDVWIALLISSLVPLTMAFVIINLNRRYPNQTFYQYSDLIVGKVLGFLFSLLIILIFVIDVAFEVRMIAEVVETYLLEGTPIIVLIVIVLWLSLYLVVDGIPSIARIAQIIFPLTIITFVIVALMSFGLFELNHLRPVLGEGIRPVLDIKSIVLSTSGVEIILIIQACMTDQPKVKKVIFIGVLVPTVIYILTLVMVIGALSIDGVANLTYPTIMLIQSFEFPELLFERFDSLFLIIWTMQIFFTLSVSFYLASLGLSQIFNKDIKRFMYGLLPIIFILSMIPQNLYQIFWIGNMIAYASIVLFGVVPFLLLLISFIRRKAQ
ncbi:GerAB/ArcD/ProY family transporter [Jeotgalibacillus marinus]|uniref:GerAB/ArcD/ProY family transporter n=1 Tax=Jeotgalibacillus marinus TaxID=86667 RepID=A0ABV3Q513_9BACL